MSLRYGKDLATTAGYIDDCGWKLYQMDPPWEKLANAIKAGNPNAPVDFSQNIFPALTPFRDLVVSDGSGRVPEIQPEFLFEKSGNSKVNTQPVGFIWMRGLVGLEMGSLLSNLNFRQKNTLKFLKLLIKQKCQSQSIFQ